uniref:Retrovirus-related Pol polyprotein from transposon TNT 1-94 n=1 Tax=Tanacetum cinerariifolium TaxID=118510 RepID=A0A6L2NW73_TANCI|nr:retrovirus-related Pol polyprotein from transposon TNT 1-94 [Tanacetum cinerariifolium]
MGGSSSQPRMDLAMSPINAFLKENLCKDHHFESDSFIYWKNRFETYIKSKDLDLWHAITNGDFQPIQQNPKTKLDEVVPFEKQSDDLKKRLAKNNEAKMVVYNALPRKEYERIFMCNTAKEIWKTLLITHQGNSHVKDKKIDLLVQQYEQFIISEDESIDSAFATFNTIITSLKALDEGYSSTNYVRKFLRALLPKWRAKVMKIKESKDLTSLSLDELIKNLKVYEMIIKKDSEIVKAKVKRKSLALKAKKESSDEECSTSSIEDEEYAMATFQRSRDEKNGKSDRKFFRCGDPNHRIEECPKPPKDKNQRAFVEGSWSDSGEKDDEKVKNETCLVAQASIEDGKVISKGIRKKGLYVMKLENKPKDQVCLATIDKNSTLWHRRLGYANMRLIQSLASKELVRNIPKLKFDQHFCDACKMEKQAHASHKAKNRVSTTRYLELLHMDLFSPFAVRSYEGNRYTLVIVDDYFRYTWTRFLKDKIEAFYQFEISSKKIQNKLGCTIVSIRTDHGRKFDNEVQFGEFCNANGITHNFSALRTRQSNGVVERKNRTLQEMSRTMLNEQSKAYIILNKHTRKFKESLNVTFDETLPPSKTSPLVDDDLDEEEEAIKVIENKNLENDVVDETLEIDKIVNIKESRNHPLENVIGNLNQRTLRSQAQNQSNFFCFISTMEPNNVNEALGDESWIVAMQQELNQFIANNVWEASINDETYASVARIESIRILLAYACALDFKLFQMDVKSAPLNDFITKEVYMAQPSGFIDFKKPNHVYKLKKALYGLKQAPKAWYDRLKAFLMKHEYKMGMVDNTLFTKNKSSNLIVVQIYVDDILFGSTCQDTCHEFAKIMHDEFKMSMMGELNFFFGLQIKQMEDEPYVLYDRVMIPLAAQLERKPRRDHGTRRGRHSTTSSTFNQPSSSHLNDDDDEINEGTSRANVPPRPLNPQPLQSCHSLDITLSLSPITPLDHIYDASSPPSPP